MSNFVKNIFSRFSKRKRHAGGDQEKAESLSNSYCEHTWDLDKVRDSYPSSKINIRNPGHSQGLSSSEAKQLLEKNGPNALPKAKEITDLELLGRQFLNFLWGLLLLAAVFSFISFIRQEKTDQSDLWVAIIIIITINGFCFISFYQERKAIKAVSGFKNLLPEASVTIRDGTEASIPAADLVVGDIIRIKNGSRVPADARILHCSQLKLETSAITGEAEPIDHTSDPAPENVNIFDAKNVAFNGSLCVDGDGVGVVIRTGGNTVIGQIAGLTTNQDTKPSRLQAQIKRFVKLLGVPACTLGLIVFLIGGFVHQWQRWVGMLSRSFLACAIGMVPCGLPATVTSTLTIVARRLSKKNIFVKKLDIVEALGSAQIIASDKTGTLTQNVMTVTNLWYHDDYIAGMPRTRRQSVSEARFALNEFQSPVSDILMTMAVCNSAKFTREKRNESVRERKKSFTQSIKLKISGKEKEEKDDQGGDKQTIGQPSEVAMIKYVNKVINVQRLRKAYDITFEIPFNSKRKWHLMIIRNKDMEDNISEYKLIMKGASEILIQKCSRILTKHDGELPLNKETMAAFQKAYDTFGAEGRRVIGFVTHTFTAPTDIVFTLEDENYPTKDLTFLGICAIMDPPRDETAKAIKDCKTAGIKVFMVTGDHYLTANAIARQIGLIEDHPGKPKDWDTIHGEAITQLSDTEWDKLIAKNYLVFARTTPEQKLLIVEQCQKRKYIIAMTGDGVNDAPALKKSDIGIAMGSGSDVAKQAADIVLMDDNFASIVRGVEEGRLMFDNIKKLLVYTMPHCFPQVWSIVLYYCFGMPLGMSALQILSIDLGTEIAPGVAMCKEPAEGDIMKRPPRNPKKTLVSKGLLGYAYLYIGQLLSLACILSYFCVFWYHGISISDLWMSAVPGRSWTDGNATFYSNGIAFSPAEQTHIGLQAQAAWQVGVVFGQFFHIWSAKTLRQSMFTHGIFANKWTIVAVTVEIILLGIFVYCPGIDTWLGGAPVPVTSWGVVAAIGLLIFAYNETRKFFIRKAPKNRIVRAFFKL